MSTYHVTNRSNGQHCYGIHDEHGLIASVYSEEAAYLFGASPELLEALQEAMSFLWVQKHQPRTYEKACAAIAKSVSA